MPYFSLPIVRAYGIFRKTSEKPIVFFKRNLMTGIQRLHSNDRTSQAVIYQHHIETAGRVAKIPHGTGIAEPTQCVLTQLEQLLHDAGSNKYRILRIQIRLTNMADCSGLNVVYYAGVREDE